MRLAILASFQPHAGLAQTQDRADRIRASICPIFFITAAAAPQIFSSVFER